MTNSSTPQRRPHPARLISPGERGRILGRLGSPRSWRYNHSKGEREKAIYHLEVALGTASSLDWHDQLFWNHFALAEVFSGKGRFGNAYSHLERAKPHAVDDVYLLACASQLRLGFGAIKIGSKKRNSRRCALLMCLRSLRCGGD